MTCCTAVCFLCPRSMQPPSFSCNGVRTPQDIVQRPCYNKYEPREIADLHGASVPSVCNGFDRREFQVRYVANRDESDTTAQRRAFATGPVSVHNRGVITGAVGPAQVVRYEIERQSQQLLVDSILRTVRSVSLQFYLQGVDPEPSIGQSAGPTRSRELGVIKVKQGKLWISILWIPKSRSQWRAAPSHSSKIHQLAPESPVHLPRFRQGSGGGLCRQTGPALAALFRECASRAAHRGRVQLALGRHRQVPFPGHAWLCSGEFARRVRTRSSKTSKTKEK
jgi:hypothetical protein